MKQSQTLQYQQLKYRYFLQISPVDLLVNDGVQVHADLCQMLKEVIAGHVYTDQLTQESDCIVLKSPGTATTPMELETRMFSGNLKLSYVILTCISY